MRRDELLEGAARALYAAQERADPFESLADLYAEGYYNDARVIIDFVETAISARASDDGWREISSAPKDGTKFLVWDEHYGVRIGRAHMRADHDDWLSYMHGFGNSSKGGLRASHWHPLPAPPAIRAQDE